MTTQHRHGTSRPRAALRTKSGGAPEGSDHAERMKTLAKQVGNQGVQERVDQARGKRDALLAFIVERLGKVREVQGREHAALNQRGRWWREVALHHPGAWSPEPERWGPVARAYRQAAETLARGHLTRGAQLLERAIDGERAALEAVPWGLGLHPDEQGRAGDLAPEALEGIGDGEGCPEGALPEGIGAAREIERFSHSPAEIPGIRVVPHDHPWWEEEEEEEEAGPDAKA